MVSRSGQMRRPCRVMSSAVLTTTVSWACGYAVRTPATNREPPTPPATTTACTAPSVPRPAPRHRPVRVSGMQPWHRWREPLAVVLLVALGLVLVLRGIGIALALAAGDPVAFSGAIPGGDDLLLLAAAAAVV